jgi:hypothetical protein
VKAKGIPHGRIRRAGHTVVGASIWLCGLTAPLLAHGGGMSGEELRPMAVSAGLALVGYWTVILWPKRKTADTDYRGPLKKKRSSLGQWARPARHRDNTNDRLRPLK